MLGTRDLRVGLSFREFLQHVQIKEPPPGGNIIPMVMWPHIEEMAQDLASCPRLAWPKARQIGASWDLAAYFNWLFRYREGADLGMFSQGQDEAQELLSKVKFVHTHLRGDFSPHLDVDNAQELRLSSMGSRVRAYPSTDKAGRGETFTAVVFDEADHHEHFNANYAAVSPALDDIGGQMFVASTVNYATITSGFKELVRGAPANGFKVSFYPWSVRPDRDQDWYDSGYAKAIDKARFVKENPSSLGEALSPPETLMAFDLAALKAMELDVKEPIETRGTIKIFQKYQPGKLYVAGTDTAHGVGQDQAVTVVKDVATGYIVADIQSPFLSPTMLADDSVKLLEHYGNPLWGVEDNDWGILTLDVAKRLGYPNLYYREPPEARSHGLATEGILGWHTGPGISGTRAILWGEMIEAVLARLLVIPSKEGLAQFFTVIRNPLKDGKIEAIQGGHDDYPMAVGIAGQVQKSARVASRGRQSRPVRLPREW
jgi:hypothetical protein